MGRIVDLLTAVAEEAEEGEDGLVLGLEASEQLLGEWKEEDLQDALGLVHDTLLQNELVEAADSLSARLVEVLGPHGSAEAYGVAERDGLRLPLDLVAQLVRRIARVEEVLRTYRDDDGPDRSGFDRLQERLLDRGIEEEMDES